MKIITKSLLASFLITGTISFKASADDNIAACEIVVQQPVISPDEEKSEDQSNNSSEAADASSGSPMIATFIPADDFVFSVFDSEEGHLKEIDGKPIQALMCKRSYLVPTEFDLRLIETHIPLYLSQDFDSKDSDLMAVFFKDDKYHYQYSGHELSEDNVKILELRMDKLNTTDKED